MFSFVQVPSTLTATSPHPITTCPPAGTWLKESLTIMKNESWSPLENPEHWVVLPKSCSSDALDSESLTWLHRRTSNHSSALPRPPSAAQHTIASQHQQPHPARNSLPTSLLIHRVASFSNGKNEERDLIPPHRAAVKKNLLKSVMVMEILLIFVYFLHWWAY